MGMYTLTNDQWVRLLAYWSVRQKLAKPCQFSSVQLSRPVGYTPLVAEL